MSDYIKLFDSKTQQDNFAESEDYIQPHISCTKGGGNLKYNNGSGGITADSITPELLENGEILRKIRNWGLSDEEIENLHKIKLQCGLYFDEDLSCSVKNDEDIFDSIYFDDEEVVAGNELDEFCASFVPNSPKYLVYTQTTTSNGCILKKTFMDNNRGMVSYSTINGEFDIQFDIQGHIIITTGVNTF